MGNISNFSSTNSDDDDNLIKKQDITERKDVDDTKNNDKPKKKASFVSFAEIKDENTSGLDYISPSSDELNEQKEVYLSIVSHRGSYNNSAEWSAHHLLQNNNSSYLSLPSHRFNNKTNHDWFIFKINELYLIKLTQISISLNINDNNPIFDNVSDKYPYKLCIQFMSSPNLKKVLFESLNADKIDGSGSGFLWSNTYDISPTILKTVKTLNNNKYIDTFTISLSSKYISQLLNNKCNQYVRISFLESHADQSAAVKCDNNGINGINSAKYCLNNIKLFGVPLLDPDNNNQIINLQMKDNNNNNNNLYKYSIENEYSTPISPSPSPNDARVFMREHIFAVNIGNKTVNIIKNEICEQYKRLSNNLRKYSEKNIILVVNGYGFINDMMDNSLKNKTFKQIGIKNGDYNDGYYITVGFV